MGAEALVRRRRHQQQRAEQRRDEGDVVGDALVAVEVGEAVVEGQREKERGDQLHPRQRRAQPLEQRPELVRSEEHTSELKSLMRISYAVFCFKKTTIIRTTRQS